MDGNARKTRTLVEIGSAVNTTARSVESIAIKISTDVHRANTECATTVIVLKTIKGYGGYAVSRLDRNMSLLTQAMKRDAPPAGIRDATVVADRHSQFRHKVQDLRYQNCTLVEPSCKISTSSKRDISIKHGVSLNNSWGPETGPPNEGNE